MSFSYDAGQLHSMPLYQVRLRLGDTESATANFQDEEIDYMLACNHNNIIQTCIDCITALLPRIAQESGFKVGPYEEKSSVKDYEYWVKLLAELKAKGATYSAPIANLPNTPSAFYRGMLGRFDECARHT